MNSRFLILFVLLGALAAEAQDDLPPASPPYYRVRYEPSTEPGELAFGVSYTVWTPPGVATLRGVIVHQHGCGEGACRGGRTAAYDWHWQALAKKHDCALLGPSYEQPESANCGLWSDPRRGSGKRFLQALADLGAQSGHPELSQVPWALWGHSGGAAWAGSMLLLHPERVAAAWLRSGSPRLLPRDDLALPALEIPAAARQVPVMCNLGTKEGVTETEGRFARVWTTTSAFFRDFRGQGGLIGIAVDPLSSHECGNQRYLAIPWFDDCLRARLPEQPRGALRPMPTASAHLVSVNDGRFGEPPQPAEQFRGDPLRAAWLPNEAMAQAWMEYVKDTAVRDHSPPPAPTDVRISADHELTWNAEADLESGLAAFVIERDGVELARLPESPNAPFGRPIFQGNSYHDTPLPALPALKFIDATAEPGKQHAYRVISINSVGLRSVPSTTALVTP